VFRRERGAAVIIIHIGNRCVRIYRYARQLALVDTITWRPAGEPFSAARLLDALPGVLERIRFGFPDADCVAIGTALMRSHPALAQVVSEICARYAARFEVLSPDREGELVRAAAVRAGFPPDVHVVTATGRGIQIVPPVGPVVSLRFGMVDLNIRFELTREPAMRRVDECSAFVLSQLPTGFGPFAYTGGEATYLRHLEVPLPDGRCSRQDFESLARRLAVLTRRDLERLSPHEPAWMGGAVASNCVVVAMLRAAEAGDFIPSDLDVVEGMVDRLGAQSSLAQG
jgi:exopolyphosphatase/pppGpp-phosphohydrolase